jgi:D-lactate dehydrogenase (cytochrome)
VPIKVATTAFNTVDDAVKTVIELLNRGVQVTCVELLDGLAMKAVNLSGQISRKYPEVPHLFSGLARF